MSEQIPVVLNEDTIIHIVREANARGVSAEEIVKDEKVVGLRLTRGEKRDEVEFGDLVVFGDERDISFVSKNEKPVVHVETEGSAE